MATNQFDVSSEAPHADPKQRCFSSLWVVPSSEHGFRPQVSIYVGCKLCYSQLELVMKLGLGRFIGLMLEHCGKLIDRSDSPSERVVNRLWGNGRKA